MADTKISEELSAAPLNGAELTEVVQSGNNRKTTTQDIANLALPLGGLSVIKGGTGATTAAGAINNLSGIPYVATNSALKALAGGTYPVVFRQGFHAAADGGAAVYYWNGASTATNDNMSGSAARRGHRSVDRRFRRHSTERPTSGGKG